VAELIRVDNGFDYTLFEASSCAFGVFDGVHRGHQFLIECAKEYAREFGGSSIALTFDTDPDEMFHPDFLQKLMTNEDRLEVLAQSGVDKVVVLPFTVIFAAYNPWEFLNKTFKGFAPHSLHIGSDFRFGAKALGTVEELKAWGESVGTKVFAHELESIDGAPVSSTRIRALLSEGKIEKANELLGRPYFLKSTVMPGRGHGVDLGFRTANLRITHMIQALGDGVYAAWASCGGKRFKAAVSVGVSPMFEKSTTATCEVHILDFSGDLYGCDIKVEFLNFLRPMIHFESPEQLSETVLSNIDWVRHNL